MGSWENKLGSLHLDFFSDDCIQNVWINTDYKFRKSPIEGNTFDLTEVKQQKIYDPDMFVSDIEQFFERIRLLDEAGSLDPLVLLNKIEGFKNTVRSNH